MKVTTEPTGVNSFVSQAWSANSGLSVLAYLRKQLDAAKGVFPELNGYEIWPQRPPEKDKQK